MKIESLRITLGVDASGAMTEMAEVCAVVRYGRDKRVTKTLAVAYEPDDSIAELAIDAKAAAVNAFLANGAIR